MDQTQQKINLGKRVYDLCYLRGEFKLRSGQISHEYFDKYRFESDPQVLKELGQLMAAKIPAGTQVLAGLEMGGIPVATAIGMESRIPLIFVRKKPK
jgi:orotate phosphoribosyltransferase